MCYGYSDSTTVDASHIDEITVERHHHSNTLAVRVGYSVVAEDGQKIDECRHEIDAEKVAPEEWAVAQKALRALVTKMHLHLDRELVAGRSFIRKDLSLDAIEKKLSNVKDNLK